jgi:signal transduction histidine kinase
MIDTNPAGAHEINADLRADLQRALTELRALAHGIYPALLQSEGLPGALREAVARVAIPAQLDCDGTRRYPAELEAAVYFCCLEALQNAAKHAGDDAHATVRLKPHDGMLEFEISDNGRGFDTTAATHGAGVQNMTDRIGALGGTLQIESTPGQGTKVAGKLPVST